MDNKICFLFGHATTPYEVIASLDAAIERHYQEYGIRTFIVGNRGSFDGYAAAAVKAFKRRHKDVSLLLLLAYHPSERAVDLTEGFDNSYYPPIEGTLRQYAIVKANEYMVDTADSIICYVKHTGNTRNLLEYARRRHKTDDVIIENVAENL